MEEPIGPRPRFSKTLSAIDIEPGDSATFECVLDEEVAANLKWLRNNVPFDDKLADRVIIASDSNVHKLTLKHCRTSDAGLITAHASNEFGATTSSAQFSIVERKRPGSACSGKNESKSPEPRESGNKPYFMLRLKDSDLMENTKAHYLVKVGGNPQPSVEFLKDGAPLKETDRVTITRRNDGIYHELFIDGVVPEDSGEYKCVAKNDAGTEECVANIAVVDEKNIWQGFENRVASPGEEPAFTWFRDGEKFEPSERFEVMFKDEEDTLALVFHNIKPEDAGMYTCMASTGSGRISCSAELTVEGAIKQVAKEPVPPLFTMDLTDTEVSMGGSAMLELKVTGHPKPKVTWYKGGEEVKAGGRYRFLYEDEESVALMIKKVEMGDAGKYTVVATNDFGEVTTEGSLFVRAPPRFKKKTSDMACMTDTPLKYEVEVEGTPAPQLKWYKDGQMIIESERVKFVQESEDKFALVIERMTLEDSGSYSVVAENEMGQISDFFKVIASSPPEFIKQMLKEIETTEGDEITFEVKIKGSPDPNVKWELDGKELKHDGTHIIMEQDGNRHLLHMKGVTRLDAGKVSCVISNEFGTQEDKSQHWVRHKPQFLKKVSDIECCEGDAHVEVTCEISARPEPDITWYYEETEIVETSKHFRKVVEGSTYKITILHVDEECMGKFTCKASNKLGAAESSGYLQVLCEPKVKDGLNDAMIDENQNAEFTCLLSGVPTPDITWYKDKIEISHEIEERITITKEGSDRYTLKLKGAVGTDAGFYEIRATNKLGATASKGKLIVNTKPVIVTKSLDTEGIETEEIVLEVKAEGVPRPSIRWYIGDMEIEETYRIKKFEDESDNTYQLRIAALKPEDAGEYECVVENMLGEARLKGKVTVKTLKELRQPKIMANLIDQTVMKGESVRLLASIRGEPTPEVHWFKDGKVANETDGVEILKCEDGFTYQISIEKATEKHHGLYEVMAKNEHGQAESQATVTVLIKPEIYDMPNVEVDHSSDITVHATVVANPKPKTKWLKDGEEYQFTERVKSYEEATDSYTLVVKQYIDVVKAESKDGGVYTIIAENEHGKMEQSFKLHINESKPTVLVPVTDVEIGVGDTATLHGKITGIPKPNLSWLKDGQPVEYSDLIVARDGVDQAVELYFKEIVKEDFAMYTLKGENLFGVVESTAELSLPKSPPRILEELQPRIKVKEGEPMVLQMKFDKLSGAEVKWYKDGHPVIPDGRIRIESLPDGTQKLIIDETISDDTGEYKVAAINNAGHTTSDCHAEVRPYDLYRKRTIEDAPLPLAEKPIISKMTDRRLVLSWNPYIPQPIFGPRAPPVTYVVEMADFPGEEWHTVQRGIRGCACEIKNLEPFKDYKFRIRCENRYGMSEPSPFAVASRSKIRPDPPTFKHYLDPGVKFRPDSSPYFPKDFDIERPPHDQLAAAPRFLRQQDEVQYGVKGHPANIRWFVYGYPKPVVHWFFNGQPIEEGGRFTSTYTRNGCATLIMNSMLERDVGLYECVATNEHGTARQKQHVELADHPRVVEHLKETTTMLTKTVKLECQITGVPYPDIKWYKDWQPLCPTSRIKIMWNEPDRCTLIIQDLIRKDEGLYSCSASNLAGSVSTSCMMHVVDDDNIYNWRNYSFPRKVPIRPKSIYDLYDIGDELGRGTQGVTYHAVERSTGRNYAAKIMHGRGHLKDYMKEEYEIMNLLNSPYCTRLVDAFETEDTFALVMELNGGGELMDSVLKQPLATEREIADYIRQVLWGLEHMHDNDIAHLGLTPGDILITRKGGVELRVSDFGLAKRVLDGPVQQRYGNPEYSAPETVLGERSGTSADMWSIGIITYLLLSGISPFRGRDDAETMDKIKSKLISYEGGVFDSLSADAKDFLQKLLRWESEDRLSCKDALKHPWFHPSTRSDVSLKTDSLREYIVHYRDWYANASCRTWFRRRPLEGAYTDPSRMVYPPGMNYTPLSTPERTIMPKRSLPAGDGRITDLIEYDQEIPDSHSMYQNGPDTYLLQLRDVDFPSRLRRYMQVASSRSPTFALKLRQDPWIGSVTVKERRRFQDLNDEEIDDERRQQKLRGPGISVSSASSVIPRRIRLEVGCGMGDLKRESEVFREQKWEGQMPFFREKLQTTSLADDSHADLTCLAVGDPKPIIQWFKNDMVIISGRRVTIEEDNEGRSFLRFRPANKEDTGVYKVVARNKFGQTVCKGRLLVAHRPGVMESPSVGEISDTEIVLKWDLPTDDGNSPIICYGLEYREADQIEWTEVAMNIDHEFFCMRNLQPLTSYEFRLYAQNAFGRSPPGLTSSVLTTKAEGAPKVKVTRAMKHLQLLTDRGFELDEELLKRPPLDYTIEDNPIPFTPGNPKEKYHFIAEMDRGRFSTIVKAFEPETEQFFVAKLISTEGLDRSEWAQREYFHLSRLQHERMAILHEAYRMDKGLVLMLDKLQGYDVLTFLAQKPEYSEELVANIIKQLFDAVQYLHWKDLVHLDIQPDNIVMASIRKLDVRLVDFGCSQQVTRKGLPVETLGNLEYMAPEVIGKEDITPQADVWSIGVVAYILLSGISPFRGATDAETTANINFARYRFEHLYREITQEASRFLMLLFKRHAVKRPTVEECLEHRWLQCTDYMIKKRERAVFNTKAIRDFSDNYHTERDRRAGNVGDELLQMVGLGRSEEVAFDTTTTF